MILVFFTFVNIYFEELKESRGYRRPKDDTKTSTKRQEVDADQSEWNLPSISDSDEGQQGNELDWETRGALNQARQKELEKRRKDLRRKIATIDDSDDPVVTISNMPLVEHPSPPFQDEEIKIEKKKKSKSDKSKKKWKKKSHKNDESFDGNANESMDKRKKTKKRRNMVQIQITKGFRAIFLIENLILKVPYSNKICTEKARDTAIFYLQLTELDLDIVMKQILIIMISKVVHKWSRVCLKKSV